MKKVFILLLLMNFFSCKNQPSDSITYTVEFYSGGEIILVDTAISEPQIDSRGIIKYINRKGELISILADSLKIK